MTRYRQPYHDILRDLLICPTAPFGEQHVRRCIEQFCDKRGISIKRDAMGNLIAVYGRSLTDSRLAFCAHMDHPGFIITANSSGKTARAVFYGGVDKSYFNNAPVRIFADAGPVRARILSVRTDKSLRRKHVRLSINAPVRRGDIGMWDLPAFGYRRGRMISRACDDLVGCGAILALLDELHRRRIRRKVTACFTVAEEAGLHGAKHLCVNGVVPKKTCILSIETSSVLPTAKMGNGVVIRVGDRTSVFDPKVTAFLLDVATKQQAHDKTFRFQRKLMDAGTCEGTVFSRFGYRCGAICIPLGNYHNRSTRTGRIGTESVSGEDFLNMVKLFLACVKSAPVKVQSTPPRLNPQKGSLGERFYW